MGHQHQPQVKRLEQPFRPQFSRVAARLNRDHSDLWSVHIRALDMQAAGEAVIMLSVGDTDLPTLPRIVNSAVTSLKQGRTHYSPGAGEKHLRETIAEIETRASGRWTGPDEIVIFPGATNAIYTVMSCLLNEGDRVVISEPVYVGYWPMLDVIGAEVMPVPGLIHDNFALDIEGIKSAITGDTRVLLLNTPGNPSGHVIPAEQLRELASYCRQRSVWIVCDEVYSMITFEKSHVSIRKAADSLENVIIVDGLSKSHAMTGWRMGWCVAPSSVIQSLRGVNQATVFGCAQFVQDAAAYALKNDTEYVREITEEYRRRRDYCAQRLRQIQHILCQPPEAGMFMMLDVSRLAASGLDFADQLLTKEKVSVLPGAGFGHVTTDFVRLSLSHGLPVLEDAFDRIERFVSSLD